MENKGTVIAVIWVAMVALAIVLVTQARMEFLGVLILLGIAVAVTFGIMGYGGDEKRGGAGGHGAGERVP